MTRPSGSGRNRLARTLLWMLLIALAAWVAIAIFEWVTTPTVGLGGPSYPWQSAFPGIRETLREIWASLTGRSIHTDLFP